MTAPADATPEADAASARRTKLDFAWTLGWAFVGALACTSVIILEPNMVEEGLVVHVAQRLAHGEHLYRDIIFFSGPLAFELLGALFRVFGEAILVGRWAQVLMQAVNAAAAFALLRRAGAGPLAHAGAAGIAALPLVLFPFFSMFYYTPLATSLALWSAYATLRGIDSTRFAFAAGVCIAGVALCKQTLGAVLAVGLLAALLTCAPRATRLARARGLMLGGLAAAALTLVFYGLRGDVGVLWRSLVTVPLSLGEQFSSRYMNLWPPGQLAADLEPHKVMYFPNLYFLKYGIYVPMKFSIVLTTQLLYALPFAALLLTLLARLAGPLHAAVWINAAQLAAMSSNVFPRSDWGHLVFALPAAGLQILLLASAPLTRVPWLRVGVAVTATALFVYYGNHNRAWLHDESGPATWGPRVPLRPVSLVYKLVTVPRVVRYIRDRVRPGDPIFVARAEPLLYFATDTTNPTPYGGVLQAVQEEQEEAILAALPKVRFVVMSDIDQPMWAYYGEELPRVQKYLERHFRIPRSFPRDDASWILVLERGEDTGGSWMDLIDAAENAEAWTLDEERALKPVITPPPKLVSRHNRRALPMRLGAWGGGIDYRLRVPPNARFEAGVGYRGMVSLDDLHEHPQQTRMRVEVGVDGVFETVADQKVSDARMEGRRWTDLSVDLSRFAGRDIILRLSAVPEIPTAKRNLSWWASPRIIVADAVAAAKTQPVAQAETPTEAPPADEPENVMCVQIYDPVCADDGKTWPNRCEAERARARVVREGACEEEPADSPRPQVPRFPAD